mgnify:CR=1 FL=1
MVDAVKSVEVKVKSGASQVRALAEKGNVILGADETLKEVRAGRLKKVFISSTPPKDVVSLLERHGVEVVQTGVSSADLGVACKKPFGVAIVGVRGE